MVISCNLTAATADTSYQRQ